MREWFGYEYHAMVRWTMLLPYFLPHDSGVGEWFFDNTIDWHVPSKNINRLLFARCGEVVCGSGPNEGREVREKRATQEIKRTFENPCFWIGLDVDGNVLLF